MDTYGAIVRFFQEGGIFMAPIAFAFAVGVIIAIERWIYLAGAKVKNRSAFNKILPMIQKKDFRAAQQAASQSNAAVAKIVSYGFARMGSARRRDDVEYAMEEGLMEAIPRLEKRTQYLSVLANVATLLGLLGTIIGLIAAFTAVAEADPSQKANLLSASISTAMNTTAFGLISAIPLLLIHSYLQSKTAELIDSLEMAMVKTLNVMTDKKPE